MNRAVTLTRVSTILQSEENGGTGIQFQTNKLEQYCKLNDLDHIKSITDIASGGLETREGIEELKTMIRSNMVDVVLVWNVSRAFRSMIHFVKFYEFLNKNNVELISVSEGIRSSSSTGKMMFGVLCSIAEMEKDLIKQRLTSGRHTKVKSGVRGFGGKAPFGYKKDERGDLCLDDRGSEIVRYIFKKMNSMLKRPKLSKRQRTSKLLKLLKTRGYKINNHDFTRMNIRRILNNRFYIGEMTYGDIKSNHNYEPIISKRLFNQTQLAFV